MSKYTIASARILFVCTVLLSAICVCTRSQAQEFQRIDEDPFSYQDEPSDFDSDPADSQDYRNIPPRMAEQHVEIRSGQEVTLMLACHSMRELLEAHLEAPRLQEVMLIFRMHLNLAGEPLMLASPSPLLVPDVTDIHIGDPTSLKERQRQLRRIESQITSINRDLDQLLDGVEPHVQHSVKILAERCLWMMATPLLNSETKKQIPPVPMYNPVRFVTPVIEAASDQRCLVISCPALP